MKYVCMHVNMVAYVCILGITRCVSMCVVYVCACSVCVLVVPMTCGTHVPRNNNSKINKKGK